MSGIIVNLTISASINASDNIGHNSSVVQSFKEEFEKIVFDDNGLYSKDHKTNRALCNLLTKFEGCLGQKLKVKDLGFELDLLEEAEDFSLEQDISLFLYCIISTNKYLFNKAYSGKKDMFYLQKEFTRSIKQFLHEDFPATLECKKLLNYSFIELLQLYEKILSKNTSLNNQQYGYFLRFFNELVK